MMRRRHVIGISSESLQRIRDIVSVSKMPTLTVKLSLRPVTRDVLDQQDFDETHIYAIATRPRMLAHSQDDKVQLSYWLDDGTIVPARQVFMPPEMEVGKSMFPHAHMVVKTEDREVEVDPFLWLIEHQSEVGSTPEENETLEVLYVGRAVNDTLTYTARDRLLEGHEKLERILAETLSKHPNRLVYVLLGTMDFTQVDDYGTHTAVESTRDLIRLVEAIVIGTTSPRFNERLEHVPAIKPMQRYERVHLDLYTPPVRLVSEGLDPWTPMELTLREVSQRIAAGATSPRRSL
jgi:hypothetical protein